MEFQKERCFSALNADELKIGSKIIIADSLSTLKNKVENDICPDILTEITDETCYARFRAACNVWHLAYLVEEPEEKKLKWTDLKLGDVITNGLRIAMVTEIDKDDCLHIYAGHDWFNDASLTGWVKVEE